MGVEIVKGSNPTQAQRTALRSIGVGIFKMGKVGAVFELAVERDAVADIVVGMDGKRRQDGD